MNFWFYIQKCLLVFSIPLQRNHELFFQVLQNSVHFFFFAVGTPFITDISCSPRRKNDNFSLLKPSCSSLSLNVPYCTWNGFIKNNSIDFWDIKPLFSYRS